MSLDKDELRKQLDELGEQQVRENLAQKIYGEKKIPLVNEWLRQKEEEERNTQREKGEREHRAEEIRVSKSARNAAWLAAIAAVVSAIFAIVAVMYSK